MWGFEVSHEGMDTFDQWWPEESLAKLWWVPHWPYHSNAGIGPWEFPMNDGSWTDYNNLPVLLRALGSPAAPLVTLGIDLTPEAIRP